LPGGATLCDEFDEYGIIGWVQNKTTLGDVEVCQISWQYGNMAIGSGVLKICKQKMSL